MPDRVRVAIVGAGLGGLTASIVLDPARFDVTVYEQAPEISRIGAGIHLGPNLVRVLQHLGAAEALSAKASMADAWVSRDGLDGRIIFRLPLGEDASRLYGAPYLTAWRADLHGALLASAKNRSILFSKRLDRIDEHADLMVLTFADGSRAEADVVIGADGVNSRVRDILLGPEDARYTGHVAFRAQAPATALSDLTLDDCAKWWGPDRHIMVYYPSAAHDVVYAVGIVPEPTWPHAASFVDADVRDYRKAFEGFHPDLVRIVEAAPSVTKWAVLERKPLALWSRGTIALLGDACHPMKPHMGQGAAMAVEDGAVLARCLNLRTDVKDAFVLYERERRKRASDVQSESGLNRWMKQPGDPTWVFGYDAMTTPLRDIA